MFALIDPDDSGTVDYEELQAALRLPKVDSETEEARNLLAMVQPLDSTTLNSAVRDRQVDFVEFAPIATTILSRMHHRVNAVPGNHRDLPPLPEPGRRNSIVPRPWWQPDIAGFDPSKNKEQQAPPSPSPSAAQTSRLPRLEASRIELLVSRLFESDASQGASTARLHRPRYPPRYNSSPPRSPRRLDSRRRGGVMPGGIPLPPLSTASTQLIGAPRLHRPSLPQPPSEAPCGASYHQTERRKAEPMRHGVVRYSKSMAYRKGRGVLHPKGRRMAHPPVHRELITAHLNATNGPYDHAALRYDPAPEQVLSEGKRRRALRIRSQLEPASARLP